MASEVEQFERNVEAGIPSAVVVRPRTLILNIQQAQAVYSAMCELATVGPEHGAEFQIGDWVYVRRLHLDGAIRIEDRADGDIERYADQAAFAAAYGLDLHSAQQDDHDDVRREAVAVANAHLNNAGLPTLHELNRAVSGGPSQVIGFDRDGQRQADFAMGWSAAMTHVWNVMSGTLIAQRAINNAEQSDE